MNGKDAGNDAVDLSLAHLHSWLRLAYYGNSIFDLEICLDQCGSTAAITSKHSSDHRGSDEAVYTLSAAFSFAKIGVWWSCELSQRFSGASWAHFVASNGGDVDWVPGKRSNR